MTAKISELKTRRAVILSTLTKTQTFINGAVVNPEEVSLEDIDVRTQKLDEGWNEFIAIESELLAIATTEKSKMDEYEEKYFKVKSQLLREWRSRTPTLKPSSTNRPDLNATIDNLVQQTTILESAVLHQNDLKLPRAHIEIFYGDYHKWSSFKDAFITYIDNKPNIPNVHKLQLLRNYLGGEPKNIICSYKSTDASYKEAWNKLVERYDRIRNVVNSLVKQFMDEPALHQFSVKGLRRITDNVDSTI